MTRESCCGVRCLWRCDDSCDILVHHSVKRILVRYCRRGQLRSKRAPHLGQLVVKDSQVAALDLVGKRLHLDDVCVAVAAASAQSVRARGSISHCTYACIRMSVLTESRSV